MTVEPEAPVHHPGIGIAVALALIAAVGGAGVVSFGTSAERRAAPAPMFASRYAQPLRLQVERIEGHAELELVVEVRGRADRRDGIEAGMQQHWSQFAARLRSHLADLPVPSWTQPGRTEMIRAETKRFLQAQMQAAGLPGQVHDLLWTRFVWHERAWRGASEAAPELRPAQPKPATPPPALSPERLHSRTAQPAPPPPPAWLAELTERDLLQIPTPWPQPVELPFYRWVQRHGLPTKGTQDPCFYEHLRTGLERQWQQLGR